MAKVDRYQDLRAWQKAYDLVLQVYGLTRQFPTEERFGLTQQLRRAAVSVPSNIAEGFGRHSRADYLRFLDHARGSVYELQTQLWIARDLGYTSSEQIHELVGDAERLLNGLIHSLRQKEIC